VDEDVLRVAGLVDSQIDLPLEVCGQSQEDVTARVADRDAALDQSASEADANFSASRLRQDGSAYSGKNDVSAPRPSRRRAGDPIDPDIAARGLDVCRTADVADPNVPREGLRLQVAADGIRMSPP
jgi:hypothetical protein